MKRAVLFSGILLLIAVPAFAITPNYVALKVGGYFPQSSDLEDFSNGINAEIAFGHRFAPMFAGEFGIGYFKTDFDFAGFDPFLGDISESDEITVVPVTVTGKAVFPAGPNAELYVGAGVGIYFAKGESDIFISSFGTDSISDDDTAFGFHLLIGGNVNINPNTFIGVEAKFLSAEASFSGTALGIPVEFDTEIDGITLTGNLGFRF